MLYFPTSIKYSDPQKMGVNFEEVSFESGKGEERSFVKAWYFKQSKFKKTKATLLFFHGNGENRSSHFYSLFWILKEGYDFLIFDYRGYADSDGESSPKNTIEDGKNALHYLVTHVKEDSPIFIFAQSLGGAVALKMMSEENSDTQKVKALILDSTFLSYQSAGYSVLSKNWFTMIALPFVSFVSDREAPVMSLHSLPKIPLLQFHGDKDQVIDLKLGEELFRYYPGKTKEFVLVPGGQHIESLFVEKGKYRQKLKDFLDQYAQ